MYVLMKTILNNTFGECHTPLHVNYTVEDFVKDEALANGTSHFSIPT